MFLIDEFIVDDFTVVEEFDSTSCWTCPEGVEHIEYLIVAGGGGCAGDTGGSIVGTGRGGGGAGGGGVRIGTNFPVIAGQTYRVTIGAGGAGSPSGPNQSNPSLAYSNGEGSSIEKVFQYGSLATLRSTNPGTTPVATGFFHIGSNGGAKGPLSGNSGRFDNNPGGCGAGGGGGVNSPGTRDPWGPGDHGIELTPANGHAAPTSYPGINQQPPFAPSIAANESPQGFGGGDVTFGNSGGTKPNPSSPLQDGPQYTPDNTDAGAGGGGAGQAGFTNAHTPSDGSGLVVGGNGGNGILTNITGRYQYFGGGGGGGTVDDVANGGLGGGGAGGKALRGTMPGGEPRDQQKGETGSANTGGGAGGTVVTQFSASSGTSPTSGQGQFGGSSGGSGKVVIRYKHPGRLKGDTVVVHEFTSTQEFIPVGDKFNYLIVAGGGGGGSWLGAGGGGGGVRIGSTLSLTPGVPTIINIGAGGAGGNPGPTSTGTHDGDRGGGSSIQQGSLHIGTNGGGGGSRYFSGVGYQGTGGSGGGSARPSGVAQAITLNSLNGHADPFAGYPGTINYINSILTQGFQGGAGSPAISPAGGGGAGGVGQNASPTNGFNSPTSILYGGNGGPPIEYISRTPSLLTQRYFAGGGGGGVFNFYNQSPTAAFPKQASGQLGGGTSTPTLKGGAGDGGVTSLQFAPFGNSQPNNPEGTSTEQQVNQAQSGGNGSDNTGGGGGGSGYSPTPSARQFLIGGTGGSGIILLEELISRRLQLFETKVFTSSTTFTTQATKADYLIVAAGGGGGNERATGGGAGGVRVGTGLALQKGVQYTINIGGGGSAGTTASGRLGGQGGGSYIETGTFHLGTNGGGGGAPQSGVPNPPFSTIDGGSGSGTPRPVAPLNRTQSFTFTTANGHNESLNESLGATTQGFGGGLNGPDGGISSGGGGAGSVGTDSQAFPRAGNGGSAISYTHNGLTHTFAGGGGGGRFQTNPNMTVEGINLLKGLGGNGGGGDFTLRGGGGNGAATGNPGNNPLNEDGQSGADNTGGLSLIHI